MQPYSAYHLSRAIHLCLILHSLGSSYTSTSSYMLEIFFSFFFLKSVRRFQCLFRSHYIRLSVQLLIKHEWSHFFSAFCLCSEHTCSQTLFEFLILIVLTIYAKVEFFLAHILPMYVIILSHVVKETSILFIFNIYLYIIIIFQSMCKFVCLPVDIYRYM